MNKDNHRTLPTGHSDTVTAIWNSVPDNRWREIVDALGASAHSEPLGVRITDLGCQLLHVDHCSLTLKVSQDFVTFASSNPTATALDEAQWVAGEGPTVMALQTGVPILLADSHRPPGTERWPIFCANAAEHGVAAVISYPLHVGAARMGALTGYRKRPGALSPAAYGDGILLAMIAAEVILKQEAGSTPDDIMNDLLPGLVNHAALQQAAGIVSEQLGVPVVDAMVRIRSHAYANNQPLVEVATSIVNREIILGK